MASSTSWTVELLSSTLTSPEELSSALKLQGEEAIVFVDALDRALDDSTFDENLRTTCTRTLRKLCGTIAKLPSSHIISSGLHVSDDTPYASGGYADVWKGRYNGRAVAIKALRVRPSEDFLAVKKLFCKEALVWKRLSHANVLPFFGASTELFQFSLVSPWMPHGNINQYIKANPEANRFLFLIDVTYGLQYLHSTGLVHGDLKGANILISCEHRALLADFGLMTIISDPISAPAYATTTTDSLGGTVRWMAPELLDPERFGTAPKNRTKSSDIYALGMVILEILTASVPFRELNEQAVLFKVVKGGRPARPTDATSMGLTDRVWEMMEGCWKQVKDQRVSISTVLKELNNATWNWVPPPRKIDEVPDGGDDDSLYPEDYPVHVFEPDSASETSSVSVQLPSSGLAVPSPQIEGVRQSHSPDSNSPDSHSPDSHSLDSHSPDSHSPDSHSPDSHSPDSHSPDPTSSISNPQPHSSDEDPKVKPHKPAVVLRSNSVSTIKHECPHDETAHPNRNSLLEENVEYNNFYDRMARRQRKPPWPGMDCVMNQRTEHDKHDEAPRQKELVSSIGFFIASDSADWGMVLQICKLASASEVNASLALKHLKQKFKHPEPTAQLAAVRLWAIILRNSSDYFKKESSSRKFLDVVEDILTNPRTPFDVRETLLNIVSAAAYHAGSNHKHDKEGFRSLWRRVKPADKPDKGVPFEPDDPMINPPLSADEDLKSIGAGLLLFPSERRAADISHRLENHFSGEIILEEEIVIQFIRSLHAWFRGSRYTDPNASIHKFSFWERETTSAWPSTDIIHSLLLYLADWMVSPSLDIHSVATSTIIVQLIQAFDAKQKPEQNQTFRWLCGVICHLWITEPMLIHESVGIALLQSAQVPGDVSRVLLPTKMHTIANGPKVLHDDIIKPLTTLADIFISAMDVSAGNISSATHACIIHAFAATLHQAFIRGSQKHNAYLINDIQKPTFHLMHHLGTNQLSERHKSILPSAYALSIALNLCPAASEAIEWQPWCNLLLDSTHMLAVNDSEEQISLDLEAKLHIALVLDRYCHLKKIRPSISSDLDNRRDLLLSLMMDFILNRTRNSPKLMWKAIYFIMVLSRFSGGGALKFEDEIHADFNQRMMDGEPFVDPGWENMKGDFRRRGLHTMLEGIPSSMLFGESVFDWRDGFPLLRLRYPSQPIPARDYPISNKSS